MIRDIKVQASRKFTGVICRQEGEDVRFGKIYDCLLENITRIDVGKKKLVTV